MGYDLGDSFPFDFEPNGISFGPNRKENCHHDHNPFNVKGIGSIVFSVRPEQLGLNCTEKADVKCCMEYREAQKTTAIFINNSRAYRLWAIIYGITGTPPTITTL